MVVRIKIKEGRMNEGRTNMRKPLPLIIHGSQFIDLKAKAGFFQILSGRKHSVVLKSDRLVMV